MSKFLAKFLLIGLFLFSSLGLSQGEVPLFDRGPDPNNPMHKELLQLIQEIPFVPGLSEALEVLVPSYKKGQKMRPDFGAMILRGLLEENSVKVLVIGQDGTHIAEGANRPGIAGFGGRVQDMLKHFGIVDGVLFTNLFVNTISGQYGSNTTPVLKDGNKIQYTKVIENRQWLLTHDGPYSQWRNRLIDWVIRNNKDSLKMVMMLGGAGKDAGANYINARGGSVTARSNIGDASKYKVPLFKMIPAGGNNEFAIAITKDGKDVSDELRKDPSIKKAYETQNKNRYKKILQDIGSNESVKADVESFIASSNSKTKSTLMKKLKRSNNTIAKSLVKYDKTNEKIKALNKPYNYKNSQSMEYAKAIMSDFPKKAKRLMVFTNGGVNGSGVLYPEQIGGWDLNTMKVQGRKTRSIQGLKIPTKDGFITAPDIVFTGSPHPTALSITAMDKGYQAATDMVQKNLLNILKEEQARGWVPPSPEPGLRSAFLDGGAYAYGRAIIPISHGDPGITPLRLLPVSTAKRAGKSAIIIGTRGNANFSSKLTKKMEKDTPSNKFLLQSDKVLTGRPQFDEWLYKYDRGPSDEIAKILYNTLDETEVFAPNAEYASRINAFSDAGSRGTSKEQKLKAFNKAASSIFSEHGIDAFPAKTYLDAGFFGHYRGTFDNPKVVILADPHGHDSFITSKAATGERGQYLNGLMQDLGIGHEYLVLNTVPFGMDDASDDEWQEILKRTQTYRDKILDKVLSTNEPIVIIADGEYAEQELKRIVGDNKFVTIKRSRSMSKDMKNAGKEIKKKISGFSRRKISGKRIDIPREHLTWIARTWEGTSGDRVITATGKEKGKVFKIVAPDWARKNKVKFSDSTVRGLDEMRAKLIEAGEPMPNENIKDFVRRAKNIGLPIDCLDFL